MNKRKTQQLIDRVNSYFDKSADRKQDATSDDDCNQNFTIIDSKLADTCSILADAISSGQVYSFGVAITKHLDNSKLRQRCCLCPGKPNPHTSRNKLRTANRLQLEKWLKSAESWIITGEEPTSEQKKIELTTEGKTREIKYKRL